MSSKPVKPGAAFERMLFMEFPFQVLKVLIGAIHITGEHQVQWGGGPNGLKLRPLRR
jgi:hypothetical protein